MKLKEFLFITVCLCFIVALTYLNLQNSFRKSRDAQRIGDIQTVAHALESYFKDFNEYPLASNGLIVACGSILEPEACEWGDLFNENYLKNLPRDPFFQKGVSYRYESNGKRFQLFASLENQTQDEFNNSIFLRNIKCGVATCNFGRASGSTQLDKTIEEYENEILKK